MNRMRNRRNISAEFKVRVHHLKGL